MYNSKILYVASKDKSVVTSWFLGAFTEFAKSDY